MSFYRIHEEKGAALPCPECENGELNWNDSMLHWACDECDYINEED